jgi:hypothetical protein
MNFNSPLFLLCSLAGVLLVLGSLYLLWKGVIDFRSGEGTTEMELTGVGTIKTPVPALVMFVLGVFLVVFPVYKSPELCPDLAFHKNKPLQIVKLRGKVATAARVEVDAVVDAQEASASNDFVLSVPYVENRRYVVRYLNTGGSELDKETFMLGPGEQLHELRGMQLQGPVPTPEQRIKLEQTESGDAVAQYK